MAAALRACAQTEWTDPGPGLEVSTDAVIDTRDHPTATEWRHFQDACGQLRDLYTRSA